MSRLSIAWKIITGEIKTKPELDGKYSIRVSVNGDVFKINYTIDLIQDFSKAKNLQILEDSILNSLKYYIEIQNGFINTSIINNRIKSHVNNEFREVLRIIDLEITQITNTIE